MECQSELVEDLVKKHFDKLSVTFEIIIALKCVIKNEENTIHTIFYNYFFVGTNT